MKMLDEGLNVTLGTDDPSISQITLTDEYQPCLRRYGFVSDQS